MQNLKAVIADLTDECSGSGITLDAAEGFKWRIGLMYRDLLAKECLNGYLREAETRALEYLAKAYEKLYQYVDHLLLHPEESVLPAQQAQVHLTGGVGRPAFGISCHQLQYLIDSRFSVPQIAELLGVSVSTVRRRMSAFNLSIRATYSSITDDRLDELVVGVQRQFPNWGNRQMYGHLLSLGIRVQYHRVRESQNRVDPEGSTMRRLRNLRRRQYSVRGPQHMWHIDGHHKLIRYNYCNMPSSYCCVYFRQCHFKLLYIRNLGHNPMYMHNWAATHAYFYVLQMEDGSAWWR